MSSVRALDIEKPRRRRIIATAMLTALPVAFLVAFLLLKNTSGATPLAAEPSHPAADTQVLAQAEAQRTPPVQTLLELEPLALYSDLAEPIASQHSASASEMPQSEVEPATLWPITNLEDSSSPEVRQRTF